MYNHFCTEDQTSRFKSINCQLLKKIWTIRSGRIAFENMERVRGSSIHIACSNPAADFLAGASGIHRISQFYRLGLHEPDKLFVGLDNYTYLLTNSEFYRSLNVTLLFGLGSVIPTIVGGLALAMLMNSKMKSSGVFRTLLFSPWVTPTVAVSIAWSWIFEPQVGLANLMLGWVGVSPIDGSVIWTGHWLPC